jgi:hypothetical protein
VGYIAPSEKELAAQRERDAEIREALQRAMAPQPSQVTMYGHTWANGGKPTDTREAS